MYRFFDNRDRLSGASEINTETFVGLGRNPVSSVIQLKNNERRYPSRITVAKVEGDRSRQKDFELHRYHKIKNNSLSDNACDNHIHKQEAVSVITIPRVLYTTNVHGRAANPKTLMTL